MLVMSIFILVMTSCLVIFGTSVYVIINWDQETGCLSQIKEDKSYGNIAIRELARIT